MADEKTISLFNGAHMQSRVEFNDRIENLEESIDEGLSDE